MSKLIDLLEKAGTQSVPILGFRPDTKEKNKRLQLHVRERHRREKQLVMYVCACERHSVGAYMRQCVCVSPFMRLAFGAASAGYARTCAGVCVFYIVK